LAKDRWTKVFDSACSDSRLKDGDLRVLIAVKLRTGDSGACWESVEKIGKRAGGKKPKTVQRSISRLKDLGYLVETLDPSIKTGRRLTLASGISRDAKVPQSDLTRTLDKSDAPPWTNLTYNIDQLIKEKEEEHSLRSSNETTLSGERLRGSAHVPPDIEKLWVMLRGITEASVAKKTLSERVTSCGIWMASNLCDGGSKANYCKILYQVSRGELKADHVVEAFEDTYTRGMDGIVGTWGAYFFCALNNIRSDLAHEEVEAELRANRA
jgi:hypothetical protein